MTEILFLSAAELAEQYRRRALSPVEALAATLARAEAIQPTLNPFCLFDAEPARAAAQASEQRWAAGTPLSPLDGIPIAIKDNQAVAGQPGASGSLALDLVPRHGGRAARGAAAGGRSRLLCPHHDARLRLEGRHRQPTHRRDAQPVGPRPDAGRILRRIGRRGGGRLLADCHRQ